MKAKFVLLLFTLTFFCVSCDNDDDGQRPFETEYLWTPSLYASTIADGSVTIKWSGFQGMYLSDVNTKCFMPNYVDPDRFEIYQSDEMNGNFVKIGDIDNRNEPVTYTVNNLPNGKPVYFRVHSLRKKYETMQSSTYGFIPNPQPKAEVLFTAGSDKVNQLVVSPDGTKITYKEYTNDSEALYVSDISGSNREKITQNSYNPAWSNDGKKIYFNTGYYNESQIMCYNCETKEIVPLTKTVRNHQYFAVSPDETKILYDLYNNGGRDLYVYDIETGKDSLLMTRNKNGNWLEYTEASWVGNDHYLVKKSKVNADYEVKLTLVSYKDNTEEDLIPGYNHFYSFAALSPDKKNIAYISILNQHPNLFVYNTSTQTTRQLTGYEGFNSVAFIPHLTWKDNSTLYYTDDKQKIVSVSVE